MPLALGALAQDGGVAVDNLTAQMPDQDWAVLAKSSSCRRSYSEFAGPGNPRLRPPEDRLLGLRSGGRFFWRGYWLSHPQVRVRVRPIQLTRPNAVGKECAPHVRLAEGVRSQRQAELLLPADKTHPLS